MKKITMILIVAAFAVTTLSAKKMTAEQKACFKSAGQAYASAKSECKAKKGKERAECKKAANKSHGEARKSCKTASAAPATAAPSTEPAAAPAAPETK